MEFDPSKLPITKIFNLKDEKDASDAAEEMVKLGFENKKEGYKVLMPKESKIAKRIVRILIGWLGWQAKRATCSIVASTNS